MIKLQDLVPEIYYKDSRDFQFIGRLFDIVLNSVKTDADNIYNLPASKNMNDKLLTLLSLTLGFQSKHKYNSVQLEAIGSVLPHILRNKGSLNAILIAVNALLHAEGIKQPLDYSIKPKQSITLYLPQQLSDLNLLQDLLIYILPAGIGCRMVKEISERILITTTLTTEDELIVYTHETPHGDAYGVDPRDLGQLLRLKPVKDAQGNDVPSKDAENLVNGGPAGKPGMFPNIIMGKITAHRQDTEHSLKTDEDDCEDASHNHND